MNAWTWNLFKKKFVMKGKMLLVAGLALAGIDASAQNYFGVTGGYNLSTLMSEELEDVEWGVKSEYTPKSGFNAGIAYEHRFTGSDKGNLFIGANLLYSLEGYKYKTTIPTNVSLSSTIDPAEVGAPSFEQNGSEAYEGTVDIKYLKVPVSFGYNFKLSENLGLAPKIFGIFETQVGAEDWSTRSRHFDFAFGAGANLNIGERLSIGLGYDWNPDGRYSGSVPVYGNAHVNVSYFILSK